MKIRLVNAADVQEWLLRAKKDGWLSPEAVVRIYEVVQEDPIYWIGHCDHCGCAVAQADLLCDSLPEHKSVWEGVEHGAHGDSTLCGDCEQDQPGHNAYHAEIDEEEHERHFYAKNLPIGEQHAAHEAYKELAREKHKKCPWAAGGYVCKYSADMDAPKT